MALAAQIKLTSHLSFKLKQEYYEMCGFVRARLSLEIVRSDSLILQGDQDNDEMIRQLTYLTNGVEMVLLTPWNG